MKAFDYIAIAAVLTLASCQVIENETPAPVAPVRGTMTLQAFAEQPVPGDATKTSLTSDDMVVWSADDSLAVFGTADLSAATVYNIASEPGTASATFVGEAVEGEVLAVYPASFVTGAASVSEGSYSIPVSIPAAQTYVEGSFPNEAGLAVSLGTDDLNFMNVMSVLELKLWTAANRTLTNLQIAAAEPLAGEATVTYNGTDAPALEFTKGSKVLTLNFEDGLTLSKDEANPTVIYAVVPAGALKGGLTVLAVQKGGKLGAMLRTTKDNTAGRSTIHDMPVNKLTFSLSTEDIGNTYIVNPDSEVSIYPVLPDMTLPGHMKSSGVKVSASFSPSDGTVSKTFSTYGSGKITYAANEFNGLVTLSISDADGIIWTYNLWTTPTPEDITLADGAVIMDRNLGALTATAGGNTFQWGRKDPVISVSSTGVVTSETVGTEEYVIAHPTAFIKTADGVNYANDWHWAGNDKLWGSTKTVWDPCPAGYRVPDGGTGSFWVTNDFAANCGTYDSTANGYNFAVLPDGATAWFPRFTYYNQAGTGYAGGYYWCWNTVSMTSGSHYGRMFQFSSTKVTNSTNAGRATSGAVRCQKIQ